MSSRKRSSPVRANTPPNGFRLDGELPVEVALTRLRPVATPPRLAGDALQDRQLFCPHYDACLDVAARHGWDDFSCRQCPMSKEAPSPSATLFAEDRPGPRD